MNFPTTLQETTPALDTLVPGLDTMVAMRELKQKGFEVTAGLRQADLADIRAIAGSEAVREYCPNDVAARFGSDAMTEEWLSGGKAGFLLRQIGSGALAGYGWTGPKASPQVPGGDTTFAIRLSPDFAGQHLATPFTATINAGTLALYGRHRQIWLETWGSNERAVHTYLNAGAELVATQDGERPTLHPATNEPDGMRRDTRLSMQFRR